MPTRADRERALERALEQVRERESVRAGQPMVGPPDPTDDGRDAGACARVSSRPLVARSHASS